MKPVLLLSSFAHYKTLSLRIVPDIYSLQGGLFIRGVVQWSTGHPNFLFVGSLTLSCDSSIYVVEHSGLAGFRHHPAVRGGLEDEHKSDHDVRPTRLRAFLLGASEVDDPDANGILVKRRRRSPFTGQCVGGWLWPSSRRPCAGGSSRE